MARVISSREELSGKLGGSVYARNKGGPYVRVFTIPINPRSQGQLAVRNGWASAVTAYHALSNEQKQGWNLFAITDYKPKYPKINVVYSGFNCFVGCKNELIQAARVQLNPTITNATATFGSFSPILTNAPTRPISANITMGAPGSTPGTTITSIRFVNATLNTTTNALTAIFRLDQNIGAANVPIFLDAISATPVGIVIMQSYPNVQSNQFTVNPRYSFATVIPPPQISATTLTGRELTFNCQFYAANKKFKPGAGDVLELNAFLTATNGLTQPIGSVKITCT